MNPMEKAAWITGSLELLASVANPIISKFLSSGLSDIVGPDLKNNRALIKLVKKTFPNCTTKHVKIKRTPTGLFRAEVRHVIFRRETVCQIISQVTGDALFTLAKDIGQGAAVDLFKQVRLWIEKGKVKKENCLQPGIILALLSFWDHTGGWGNYHLIHHKSNEERWTIRVDSDFLNINIEDGWSDFWRGYFWGFCDLCIQSLVDVSYEYSPNVPDRLVGKLEVGTVKEVTCDRQGDGFLCAIQFSQKGK